MPAPSSRDAPKFNPEKPSELIRFLSSMEDLFSAASITDDDKRKKDLCRYAPASCEHEWQAFNSYKTGTYAEFKAELIASYPEASHLTKGSLGRLKAVCADARGITSDDLSELLRLKRSFVAEATKLSEPPALLSNMEIIQLFAGCLSDEFRRQVASTLAIRAEAKRQSAINAQNQAERRVEDQHTWNEVIEAAVSIAETYQNPLGSIGRLSGSLGVSDNRERPRAQVDDFAPKMEESMARLADTLNLQLKQHVKLEEKVDRCMTMVISVGNLSVPFQLRKVVVIIVEDMGTE
ncbi:hypothetical protein NLJ89_g9576 [Agrocybe chaxingu]|uniref:Uncharacterized protein n=1 Tax=Agrocybe chaxingu TaxID=84603 RepID=A0A9W8JT10_9AGAR|nr:hypothetical protein NLJ89_g9576 [Agrocybe chaxingu]